MNRLGYKREATAVPKGIRGYTIAVCMLVSAFLCLRVSDDARGADAASTLQILYLANSNALLEPCG